MLVPAAATRGAATKSQSRMRWRAASRAAACVPFEAFVIALWQNAP